jgi:hypothetical protein
MRAQVPFLGKQRASPYFADLPRIWQRISSPILPYSGAIQTDSQRIEWLSCVYSGGLAQQV